MEKITTTTSNDLEAKIEKLVLVHADGPPCHGKVIINGRCTGCGQAPDMQSTELWPPTQAVS